MSGDFSPRLNDAQRAEARRRWEGIPEVGFTRLADECAAAWGITITPQALRKAALKAGWQKSDTPSEPLMPTSGEAPVKRPAKQQVKPKAGAAAPVMLPSRRPMVARTGAQFVRLRACPPGR